jgi:hypothetical protein
MRRSVGASLTLPVRRGRLIVLHGVIAGLDRLKTALGGSDA